MSTCKNEEMNRAGTGKQNSYPRSCPTCGLGNSCSKGVTRDPASTFDERYYVGGKREPTVPKDKYAVFTTQTIHHEGDERSRTNPGHGYPAYSENIDSVIKFDSEEALKQWIERNNTGYGRKNFTAIKYQELRVNTSVSVSLV